jgi:hypothetical protein
MPIEYSIDVERRIVRTQVSGVVTIRETVDHMTNLRADLTFFPDFGELITFAGDANLKVTYLDVRCVVHLDAFSEKSKRAFVIPVRGAVYGIVRMYQSIRDGSPYVQIFDTVGDAMTWLSR